MVGIFVQSSLLVRHENEFWSLILVEVQCCDFRINPSQQRKYLKLGESDWCGGAVVNYKTTVVATTNVKCRQRLSMTRNLFVKA